MGVGHGWRNDGTITLGSILTGFVHGSRVGPRVHGNVGPFNGGTMRPEPNTHAGDIYKRLLVAQSRAGQQCDMDRCAELAFIIQRKGHRSPEAVQLANELGLDPTWLPRQRR